MQVMSATSIAMTVREWCAVNEAQEGLVDSVMIKLGRLYAHEGKINPDAVLIQFGSRPWVQDVERIVKTRMGEGRYHE